MNIHGMYRDHYPKSKLHCPNLGLRLRWAAFLSTRVSQCIHVSFLGSPAHWAGRKQYVTVLKTVKHTTFLHIFPCKQVWTYMPATTVSPLSFQRRVTR